MNFQTTAPRNQQKLINDIGSVSYRLENAYDLDPLIDRIGDAQYVLLGEASHGTHEYYTWRTAITRQLIEEKGFSFVAVEGDWPDCFRLNRFIKGYEGAGHTEEEVLKKFDRWPTWMWANWEVAALLEWLREYNVNARKDQKVGFYGLDLYSLGESLEAIFKYLNKEDPQAAADARKVMECFNTYGGMEGQAYAMATRLVPESCEDQVVHMLAEISSRVDRYNTDPEMVFSTEQNAKVAVNAERYYRAMVGTGPDSWNIRDRHMVETLEGLMDFYGREHAKCIIWEHNTHIGDARATTMARGGMVNVGQLVREKQKEENVVLIGFGSYKGSVIAGRSWGAPMEVMNVPEAKEGSWEHLLHNMEAQNRLLIFEPGKSKELSASRLEHRAIGVVYNPAAERYSNYVLSNIPQRYDAFLYIDETEAVHPLHLKARGGKVPETYPWAM